MAMARSGPSEPPPMSGPKLFTASPRILYGACWANARSNPGQSDRPGSGLVSCSWLWTLRISIPS